MKELNLNEELPVLVLPDRVLLHPTNMNMKIGKKIGSEIHQRVKDHDFYGIVLAVKEFRAGRYAKHDFHRVGTLIRIENAHEMRDFYHLKVDILERVQIDELIPDGMNYRAKYHLTPDEIDLDPVNQEEILKHIRF